MNSIRSEFQNDLQMDAMRLRDIETLNPELLFSHVLPRPWVSTRNELYIITVNQPVVFEVELGILGRTHIEKLFSFLAQSCARGVEVDHIRTDGYDIWSVLQEEDACT